MIARSLPLVSLYKSVSTVARLLTEYTATSTQMSKESNSSLDAPAVATSLVGTDAAAFVEIADAPPAASCWKCRGSPRQPACKVCGGTGLIPRAKEKSKRTRPVKLYPSYDPPGPKPLAPELAELRVREDEDLCFLIGHWKIFQQKSQHRYSTDDVVTAWVAYRMGPRLVAAKAAAARAGGSLPTGLETIDIGCGIGSVVLMTAWLFPDAQCRGVEAQLSRYNQALRSLAYNGVGGRVTLKQGDLRDPSVAPSNSFDLVTGSLRGFASIRNPFRPLLSLRQGRRPILT